MSSQPKIFHPAEQCLEVERKPMFDMERETPQHARIISNLKKELVRQLNGRAYTVSASDLRLVLPSGLYTYPDLMVLYGEPQSAEDQNVTLTNPILIIEVLSDSTRDYDLGRKLHRYRKLPSLREYLAVEQIGPRFQHWARHVDTRETLADYKDLSQSIQLTSIDCVLSLAEIYHKVDWTHV